MIDVIAGVIARIRNDPALVERITPETQILDELALDSVEVVELMLGLEDALDRELPYATLQRRDLASVRTLADAINRQAA